MRNSKKYLLIIPVLALVFVLLASSVQAVSVIDKMSAQTGAAGVNTGYDNTVEIKDIVGTVINTALSLLGIIFLGLIIMSGYAWMSAGGDEKVIETSKSHIKNAVIGLIIVLAAYSITAFVFSNLNSSIGGGTGTGTEVDGNANSSGEPIQ
jgi:hypothetical protein